MRVLHLPSSYFPDSLGGTEVYVRQLAESLARLGHESQVAWHTSTKDLGVGQHALPPLRPSRLAVQTKDSGQDAPGFAALLRALEPDIVHFHAYTVGAGPDHARVLARLGIPYLITVHTPSMVCPRGTWLRDGATPCDGVLEPRRCTRCLGELRGWSLARRKLASLSPLDAQRLPDGPLRTQLAMPSVLQLAFRCWETFFRQADCVVACAEFVAERLVANGLDATKIEVLRQALPGATRRRTLRVPRLEGRTLRAGYLGRITHSKGPDLAIAAIESLRARGVRAELQLVGPLGSGEEGWFQAQLRERPWARHLGAKRDDELRAWLAQCDLILVPSRGFETGPLTILEAWDLGVPAVGTDLGGIAETMRPQGQASLLFPLADVQEMVSAVERGLSGSGYATQVEIFGMDGLGARMDAIYRRIMDSPSVDRATQS